MAKHQPRRQSTRPPTDAAPKKPGIKRRRVTDGLIGLGSAAVVTVYALGYVHTRAAANEASASESAYGAPVSTVPDLPRSAPQVPAQPTQPSRPQAAPNPTPTPAGASQSSAFRDGTYIGQGSSRHGGIEATIVIKNGAIASAAVSRCGTQYPCQYVDPLVKEVVQLQGPPVHYMSGATDSSSAYRQAVTKALAQAK